MRERLSHPLVVAALVGIVVLLPVAGLATLPRWTLDPLPVGSPGEDFQPGSWSPDGTRFIFQRLNQFIVVRAADGAVLRTGYGWSPIWVDDDTIDSSYDVGLGRAQIHKLDLHGSRSATLPIMVGSGRLVGRGVVDLAAPTADTTTISTTVFDPIDGRQIRTIAGVRPIAWIRSGLLIGKTIDRDHPGIGDQPGSLVAWTADGGVRSIGPHLLDVRDMIAASPEASAIACVCVRDDRGEAKPPEGIYRVPIDGSSPTRLADVATGSINSDPVPRWFDDGSLVYLDGAGLHRIGPDGEHATVPVDAGDLPSKGYNGRLYGLGNAIVLASQVRSADTGEGKLTVMNPTGEVGYRQSFPSWNGLGLILAPGRPKALVFTDPHLPNQPPQRFFVLSHQ